MTATTRRGAGVQRLVVAVTGTAPRIVLLLDFAGGGHVAPEQWPGWIQQMHGAHQLAVRAEVADDGPGSANSALL